MKKWKIYIQKERNIKRPKTYSKWKIKKPKKLRIEKGNKNSKKKKDKTPVTSMHIYALIHMSIMTIPLPTSECPLRILEQDFPNAYFSSISSRPYLRPFKSCLNNLVYLLEDHGKKKYIIEGMCMLIFPAFSMSTTWYLYGLILVCIVEYHILYIYIMHFIFFYIWIIILWHF